MGNPSLFTRVFRSLKILHSLVDGSHLSTVEISWLTSKVEEAFNAAKIVAKTEELVDIERLRLLSSQDSTYTSKIAHMEDHLKELFSETLQLELREKEILKKEERIYKMRKDLMDQKQKLVITKGEFRTSLDLVEAGVAKLQDLDKEKIQLNHLVNSIVSFHRY
ncbi:hypothetical protein Cgig2_027522 [Carnegiea gigantea]|uniref:Uncharacterized protein n=1 Tax=Carnegiea gigantea TaxID=171969 RepID=A0A9Q1GPK5_9CARY|nr:hypothetical protein Cgig2_027522 [Carnegiea gigantea]